MTDVVEYNLNYRNFSEIDYLLGSNLSDTPWGVSRLIQRLPLFDLSKRHIPYLLLIHKVFYNNNFPLSDKKDTINTLLNDLYRNVIKKNERNQILDFFPEYYVYYLLLDLYIAGYKIDRIFKGHKYHYGPAYDLMEYSDFSSAGFPESFKAFTDKYVYLGQGRERFLTEMARAALHANNLPGFYAILGFIRDKDMKAYCLTEAAMVDVERNEIGHALKIAESARDLRWKSECYTEIAYSLSSLGKIELLLEIRKTITVPEALIGIVCGLMDYYTRQNNYPMVEKLFEEALVFLDKIKDYFIKSTQLCLLMRIAHKNGDYSKVERCLNDILRYDSWISNDEDRGSTRIYFCRVLILIDKSEQAMELSRKWHMKGEKMNEYWQNHNLNTQFNVMVLRQLDTIDANIHLDSFHQTNMTLEKAAEYYRNVFKIADMMEDFIYKEDSLHLIALNMAKHGFYTDALKIRDTITGEGYHTSIDSKLPMYALVKGDVTDALHYAGLISDQKTKLSVQLCMAPHLEKLSIKQDSTSILREWANYIFQFS